MTVNARQAHSFPQLGIDTVVFTNPFRRRGEGRPRSRAAGCLLWILLLIALLIVLSVLFGGFQKGTKVNNGLGIPPRVALSVPMAWTTSPCCVSPTVTGAACRGERHSR
ncbi:MAG: hypothetical protein JOY82_25190 [Streptosporangiaceae bacterium]|nr:hypothetical protein [Streptosporangiaceae bacterium]MBV9857782.1 hypothetical protein [Streptosporangiaceae bacterium]